MGGFFIRFGEWFQSTNLPEQISGVDAVGLFTNPWFLVPFIVLVGYLVWKQSFNSIIIIVLFIIIWWLSGTEYMQTLVVNGEVQIKKVLPVLGGAAGVLAGVIYMYFGRS
jgi:hypothetical protein